MSINRSSDPREPNKSSGKSDNITVFWGFVVLFAIIWFLSPIIMSNIKSWIGSDASSSYESINSLFSAWAFAGVIYNIILQRKELSLQREELYRSRIEYEKQSIIMEEQMKSLQAESALNKKNHDYNRYYDFIKCEPIFIYETEKRADKSTIYKFYNVGQSIYFVEMKAKSPSSTDYYASDSKQLLQNKHAIIFELSNFYTNVKTIIIEIKYKNQIGFSNTKILHLYLDSGKIVEKENSYEKLFNVVDIVDSKEVVKRETTKKYQKD